jgi:hypothetical protein
MHVWRTIQWLQEHCTRRIPTLVKVIPLTGFPPGRGISKCKYRSKIFFHTLLIFGKIKISVTYFFSIV